MDSKGLRALFLIALGLLVTVHVNAAIYKLPLRTTTLAVSYDYYDQLCQGEPIDSYDLYVDAPVLSYGFDVASGTVYESAIAFDWSALLGVPGRVVSVRLNLTPISLPVAGENLFEDLGNIAASVPALSDFYWYSRLPGGGVINLHEFDPRYPVFTLWSDSGGWPLPVSGYSGWVLSTLGSGSAPGAMAGAGNGQGLESPYMLVTTVPETPSWLCLGAAICSLLAFAAVKKRGIRVLSVIVVGILVLLSGLALADEDVQIMNSEPGTAAGGVFTATSGSASAALPSDFTILPAFPRFFWSYGCVPTCGAMIIGYYDNAGFPRMFRNSDGSDTICPTGNYPNDNGIFLKTGDAPDRFPSRCAISATEMGVLDRQTYGHVEDYYVAFGGTSDPYVIYQFPLTPWYIRNWDPHSDDCVADFMGTSIYRVRRNKDGQCPCFFGSRSGNPYVWVPPTCSPTDRLFPYPNTPPVTGSGSYPYKQVDASYGLARYVVDFAGYHCRESYAVDLTGPYYDVSNYYNRYVNGCLMPGVAPPPLGETEGATGQAVKDEIDAGRPIIVSAVDVVGGFLHAFPVFGYKEEQGQPLQMLAYDTWYEDAQEEDRTYRIVPFPTPSQAGSASYYSFTRQSDSTSWRVYAVSCLNINDNPRCDAPLADEQGSEDKVHEGEFDLVMAGQGEDGREAFADCTKVHYDAADPNPASDSVSIADGTATLHTDHDCAFGFRTYKDVNPPDGFIASKVVRRVYSVFGANKNVKKLADDAEVTTVNGIVTHVVDDDNFYFEERDKRLFGIRVNKVNHGLQIGDDVEAVLGTMKTGTNGERYIEATAVTVPAEPSGKSVEPLCMTNGRLGGADFNYNPTTGAGQQGVKDGAGLNNIGLLVRTAGCVCSSGTSTFAMTDGAGAPVKVVVPSGVDPPAVERYVGVTGISSCEMDGQDLAPVLLVRNQDDITDYAPCETCGGGSQRNAPVRQWPEPPVYEGTDTVAWAVGQSDGTAVAVVGAYVTKRAADGLSVVDIRPQSSAAMRVLGNWDVPPWGTVDVSGIVTTLSDGTRAVVPSQLLIYTDTFGRQMPFGVAPRGPAGQPMPEWPYKRQATRRSM